MEEVKNKDRKNITYLLIGLLTLILSTSGATFAYLAATASAANSMTGDMASITFTLDVKKMTTADDDLNRGLIPMSNSMVEKAVANQSVGNKGTCLDDNGNAVCQIYKISVANTGTASMLLDGYVTLENGSGTPVDFPNDYYVDADGNSTINYNNDETATSRTLNNNFIKNSTTMRWAQAFCDEANEVVSNCTTVGKTTTTATKSASGSENGITKTWAAIQNLKTTAMDKDTNPNVSYGYTGLNRRQILTSGITTKATIAGSDYDIINTNFIRISNHEDGQGYTQTKDITSALIYNEFLNAKDDIANPAGDKDSSYTDSQVYYIVVWLTETGVDQTITSPSGRENFFTGTVKFISAQGSEVTATFSNYSSVRPDTLPTNQ